MKTDEEIKEYAIKDNLLRRHLKPEQRAFLEAELATLYKDRVGKRRDYMTDSEQSSLSAGKTSELIALDIYNS